MGESRASILASANQTLGAGNLAAAASLYERALNTPPTAAETAVVTSTLDDFARFRLLVIAAANGEDEKARAQLSALTRRQPPTPFATVADELWHEFGMTSDIRAACTRVAPQLAPMAPLLREAGVTISGDMVCGAPAGPR